MENIQNIRNWQTLIYYEYFDTNFYFNFIQLAKDIQKKKNTKM